MVRDPILVLGAAGGQGGAVAGALLDRAIVTAATTRTFHTWCSRGVQVESLEQRRDGPFGLSGE